MGTARIGHGDRAPCRIFLSYSRADLAHAKELHRRLEIDFTRLPLKQATGLQMADVFFDEPSLRGENDWSGEIERALDTCQIFILLISANSLQQGSYCRKVELPIVLRRDPQPRFIAIHLEKVSGWAEMEIAPGRTLQPFRGYPIINGQLLPPRATDTMPWDDVIEDLHKELELLGRPGELAEPKSAGPIAPLLTIDEKLLPYFCNQQKMEDDFLDGVDVWKRSQTAWALITIYKGCYDDGLMRLARRMRFKHLRAGPARGLVADWAECSVEWPDPEGMRPERQAVFVVNDLLQKLGTAEGVTRAADLPQAALALGASLQQRNSPLHVMATLPDANLKDTTAGIREVLKFLDHVPMPQPRPVSFRLVLDLFLEPALWDQSSRLGKSCKPPGATASHLLELSLPELLKDRDIRNWHRSHLADHVHPDKLMEHLGARLPVRQRVFAELVEPLLTRLPRR